MYFFNIYFLYFRLHTIDVHSFASLNSLEWLYLQTNQLKEAPYEMYRTVLDTLQVLDLHGNEVTFLKTMNVKIDICSSVSQGIDSS